MTIYYFDQFDGSEIIRDDEGQEFADLAAVRLEATIAVRELVAIVVARGESISHRELRVRSAEGLTVLTVPFGSALGLGTV